jgi:hypothetical protein
MAKLLAPVAPPCFRSRDQWTEYLSAAAAEQRQEHEPGPLVFTRTGIELDSDAALRTAPPALKVLALTFQNRRVTFNVQMDFCSECTKPDYLRELSKEPAL